MDETEKRSELPTDSMDEALSSALTKVGDTIEQKIRAKMGDANYDQAVSFNKLDRSLEESLSEDTRAELREERRRHRREQEEMVSKNAVEASIRMFESDESPFDEDSGRHVTEQETFQPIDQRKVDREEDPLERTFAIAHAAATKELRTLIGAHLEDRYAQHNIELYSIDGTHITFHSKQQPVDTNTNRALEISFETTDAHTLKTNVSYVFIDSGMLGKYRRRKVETDALKGVVEGVSLESLKKDTLRAVQMALERDFLDPFSTESLL